MQIRNDVTRQSLAALGQRVCFSVALLLAPTLLFAPSAYAQYDNGSAVGTIHDASCAAVPNATVKITNNATSISTETKSNGSGDYEVPTLKVGVYTITTTAP